MRTTTVLFTLIATATLSLTACGGGGDDDGAGDDDSAGTPDAMTSDQPDAMPGNAAMGLGQACNQTMQCPQNAGLCGDLDNPPDMAGFCTLSCGTTGAVADPQQATPPAGGDAMCAAAYTASAGTPECVLYVNAPAQNPTMATWYCGVTCSVATDCPSGLTCQEGLCDD